MKKYLHPVFLVRPYGKARSLLQIFRPAFFASFLAASSSAASFAMPLADDPPSLTSLRPEDLRVAAVVHRLATSGAPFCTLSHPVTGLVLHQLGEYAARDRPVAEAQFGLSRGPGIVAVVPGSPAARIGLAAGDVLITANEAPFPASTDIAREPDDKKRRKRMEEVEARLEHLLLQGPVRLGVWRSGQRLSFTLRPIMGCEARGRLARSSQANAFADGRYAIMTTRMLNFLRNDDELAIVMAHEIAHNLLRHRARLDQQKRGFFGGIAQERAKEEEAERLAVKLLWSAGYDLSASMPFWRRLHATFNPLPTPKFLNTHPSLARRQQIITDTIRELKAYQEGADRGPAAPQR